jgi:polynucleotide 5'-hydroxyl-kinase GRC3/NOL9
MMEKWADVVADRIVGTDALGKGTPGAAHGKHPVAGVLLLLGAADTGKTTLLGALFKRLVRHRPVALVDADIGQSHLGPPTTVGWSLRENSSGEAVELRPRGIAFVGDVTPMGHLLQLTAALALCVEQARRAANVVLIDTPGLVTGGAACSLWWTIQRLLRPERIIAIQRTHELDEVLGGLQTGLSRVDRVKTPARFRRKSPEARQEHRRRLFEAYFRGGTTYTLSLKGRAVRSVLRMTPENVPGHVVGLTDAAGQDMAVGVIERWQPRPAKMTIRAPQVDIRRVRCLTIGNARVETSDGWSG